MKIHVLIVDDAVIVRNRVSKILSTVDDIEVVGVAASGKIALLKIPQLNPDVVILDVNMPDMDGLETLAAIRAMYPKLPVIMFSALTVLGATTTLDALILGANDYATKPSNLGSIEAADQHILAELVPKIKALLSAESIESAESKVLSAESIESNNIPNSTEVFPLSPSTNSSLPTTHHPPLTTHHSPPTTHHPPPTTHHSTL